MEVAIKYYSTISTYLFLFMLTSATSPTDFLRSSCKSTSYPNVCMQSLTNYTPPVGISYRQLAHAAVTVSTNHARDTSKYLSTMSSTHKGKSLHSGGGASSLGDCTVAMADSAMRLQKAEEELRRAVRDGSRRFALRISNVLTWVSAALTDQNMCIDSLSTRGGRNGAAIRRKVVETSRITSNALSLVNGIGSRN